MAEFLTTQGTSYYLENIIINASERLILVSPYLNISANFMARLQDADKRKVEIILIYGKDELKPQEKQKLTELQHLSLYYYKNLHAKCYLNSEEMIITSMNMHEFSEKTNREMGVLVRKDLDNQIYNDALKEVNSILASSEVKSILASSEVKSILASSEKTVKKQRASLKSLPPVASNLNRKAVLLRQGKPFWIG